MKELKDYFGNKIPKTKSKLTDTLKEFSVTYLGSGYTFKVVGPGVYAQIELPYESCQDALLDMLVSAYEAGELYKEGQAHHNLFGRSKFWRENER